MNLHNVYSMALNEVMDRLELGESDCIVLEDFDSFIEASSMAEALNRIDPLGPIIFSAMDDGHNIVVRAIYG